MSRPAILALEDGSVFQGVAFGAEAVRTGEVVFNTAITGYQEVFTDPSYTGQIVVLTYPHIGNYGTNDSDSEAARPYIEGLVVRDFNLTPSNWRAQWSADEFLRRDGIPVISGVDARALVRRLLDDAPRNVRGLAVPGMPVGSPGMEVPGRAPQPYDVLAFDARGKTRVYARR